MWIIGCQSRGPASNSVTLAPDTLSRLAMTQPADPAPTTT
jgi:hypothetical protein